jgi:hypothetical protein
MGETTKQWAPSAYPSGIRTVILEENGDQSWGVNIHGLRRALNHAQVVAGIQRVPSPARALSARGSELAHPRPSQVVMSTQANCLQADAQNYYCPPPDPHANSWDQGTVFYNSALETWGQPTFWSAKMMSESHQPYVVQAEFRSANGTTSASMGELGPISAALAGRGTERATPAPPANWSIPVGLDVIALRSRDGTALTIRVVNPQPTPITATVHWGASFTPPSAAKASAVVSSLTSRSLNDSNTAAQQNRVVPKVTRAEVVPHGLAAPLRFLNASFTTIVVS